METRRGVVCFASVDFWYFNRAHSEVQLMRRIARDRPVLFVNSIGMRMPTPGKTAQPLARIARKLKSTAKVFRRPLDDTPDFAVLSPLIVPAYGNDAWRARNAAFVRRQVNAALRRMRVAVPDIVVTIPTAVEVADGMTRRKLLFNRCDLFSSWEETDQALIRTLEDRLLTESDHTFYVNHQLMEAEADRTNGRAVFLDHGVDLSHFRPGLSEPEDMKAIRRPRIGFFGAFDDYTVDVELLVRVAREIPEAELVLIGGTNMDLDALTSIPNVTWLGARPYESIAAYGANFDVALMPWLRNSWIDSSNPIKMKEYLALGLPVVTTDFPEARRYADVMTLTADSDAFVAAVKQRLVDHGPGTAESRRRAVMNDDWNVRAGELLALIDD